MTIDELVDRIRDGETLRALGREVGLTGERVRQLVTASRPDAGKEGVAARRALKVEQHATAAEARGVVTALRNGPCLVCTGPVTRKGRRTCSPRCVRLWPIIRNVFSDDYHEQQRQAAAAWALRTPDTPKSFVAKAHRATAGLEPNRRYQWADSNASHAVAEARLLREEVAARGESWWT